MLVGQSAVELGSGELWSHLWISLQRLLYGLLAGVGLGALLGASLGFSRRAERLVFPTFSALAQIPTLAWIPLFMVFFGIGELLKLVVLIKAIVVPVTLHTLVGVRDAQPRLREAAAVLRLPPSLLVRRLMVYARQLFMLDIVFVCILVIGVIGVLMDRGIALLDRRLVHWPHPATAQIPRGPRYQGWQRLQPWLLPLTLLVLWQLASELQWVDGNILASPLAVLHGTWNGLLDGSLPRSLGLSLKRTLAGLLLGGSLGLGLGLLLGLSTTCERLLGPRAAPDRDFRLGAADHRLVRPG